ncbi:MAG TPA: ferric reductase-like transmembrane domain-containing protein [Anaeromyxobacteraceae bacterium]|nr:ferric reductase-like transmembrane domain-containing protein [Anaeromyxobacteraceae bacterium]
MTLIVRGIFWFGLYVFLVTFPLLAAVLAAPRGGAPSHLANAGVAAGYLALAMMALEMALVARVRAAASAFGQDALLQFHRGMGVGALVLLLLHPALLVGSGAYPVAILGLGAGVPWAIRLGTVAALCALVVVTTSLLRRRLGTPYETWQVLHGVLAVAAVVAAAWHASRVGRLAQVPALRAVGAAYVVIFLGVFVRYRLVRPLRLLRRPWEVVSNAAERGDARTIVVRPVGHPGFSFEPGQFAWINLGRTPFHLEQHPMSMVSGGDVPPGGEIAFTIRNLGDWSGRLVPSLRPGARAWIDGPYGAFSIDRHEGPGFVLVAGGIGVTPMVSFLRTMASRGDARPVLLVLAAHSEKDLTLREALDALAPRLALRTVLVLERPGPGWAGETGLVDADLLRRHLPPGYRRFQFFTCGPPPLMDAMERALPLLGVAPERIHAERFDMV